MGATSIDLDVKRRLPASRIMLWYKIAVFPDWRILCVVSPVSRFFSFLEIHHG
jgi:hypothetical protein